jgi:hypothetical protein
MIMAKLVTEIVYGYDKEEAMKDLNLEIKHNATTKWKNEGQPTFGSAKFIEFCQKFIDSKKMTSGGGAYIVKNPAQKDTRLRPYSVISYKKEGKTKWETKYNVCEYNDETGEIGKVVNNEATTKAEAEAIAKDLTTANKRDYICRKTKEVVEDENSKNGEILFRCIYTPSKSAEQGEFYVFGLEKE